MKKLVPILAMTVIAGGIFGMVLFQPSGGSPGLVPLKVETTTIGGPFTLTDHTGKTVTEKDFLGRYMMVYFGYTFCPDVCPTSLQYMVDALDQLPEDISAKVVPIFISVDPDRDDIPHLARYVDLFHPRLIGLTGTRQQIDQAVKGYRASYQINKTGPDDDAYTVDHSSITMLMGPDGKYIKHFPYGMTGDRMALRIKELIAPNVN